MAAFMKFLIVTVFLFGLFAAGINSQQCSLSNIKVSQAQSGKKVQNKPEWTVTITNDCICGQSSLTVDCSGFQTVEAVDPSILKVSGSTCLINNGLPVFETQPISFNYAWDSASASFKPLSSQINCS
ncbi:TPD1 protein homolog 1-like [Ziziphus jujuba]|uniref:TPD1 protein homolog 1-like n=1 Tax=Ziziphus jujuba TaxID=326968 RepID=A0ABM3IWT4_ZIZJJ|nr:TPD1 protein homolog 1-like [Ziziphus jujuba]